jgi:hypothetical protein
MPHKTASVNYSDAGALPDFEEILTTCPTTADATAIWSKMGWSHFTSGTGHWTRVSAPRVGAGSRTYTEAYEGSDASCTAYLTIFHKGPVFGGTGYCAEDTPRAAIKAAAEQWTAKAAARLATVTTAPTTTTTKPATTTTTTKPAPTTTTTAPHHHDERRLGRRDGPVVRG